MSELEIRDEAYTGATAQALIAAVQAEYVERYGGPDTTPVDPAEFAAPTGLFLVGYLDGEPVAMGGLRRHPDALASATGAGVARHGGIENGGDLEIEIKRMYVVPSARGNGLSRLMLAALEDRARGMGACRVVLETGQRQPEAINLYRSSGYQPADGFGHYRCAPLSLSFAKDLRSPPRE